MINFKIYQISLLLLFSMFNFIFSNIAIAASLESMKNELSAVTLEIKDAEQENSKYQSGLIKSLILIRIETLKITKALIDQRIQTFVSGAPIELKVNIVKPNLERAKELELEILTNKQQIEEERKKASKYKGGLILAMKLSGIATKEQTIAMLHQEYIKSKYGIVLPSIKSPSICAENYSQSTEQQNSKQLSDPNTNLNIILPQITNKIFSEEQYEKYIRFNTKWIARNLKKPARSIKGVLHFEDLFGERKFGIIVTLDERISPNEIQEINGLGFEYNQFNDSHKWVNLTKLKNMKFEFEVTNILYEDGEHIKLK
jgi:hypothetical protein